jgi:hypothetical protein
MEDEQEFSVGQLIKGIFAGLLIGLACLVLDFLMGFVLYSTHYLLLGTILTAGLLIGISLFAVKHTQDRGFLRGLLISLSLAFIACTLCGVAIRRPFVGQ